jgi:hypothetical protein
VQSPKGIVQETKRSQILTHLLLSEFCGADDCTGHFSKAAVDVIHLKRFGLFRLVAIITRQ